MKSKSGIMTKEGKIARKSTHKIVESKFWDKNQKIEVQIQNCTVI